jgi:hypothetical protein
MRRIIVVLTIAAVMAAMLVASAVPAFAGHNGTCHVAGCVTYDGCWAVPDPIAGYGWQCEIVTAPG